MNNGELIKLNNNDFSFTCGAFSNSIVNGTSTPQFFPISFGSVNEIVINDNLFDPFVDVELSLKTPGSFLENTPFVNFSFKSNNRNLISFSIEQKRGVTGEPQSHEKFKFVGAICDSNVITSDTSLGELQTFKLIDANEASLRETKVSGRYEKIRGDISVSENIFNIINDVTGINKDEELFRDSDVNIDYLLPNHFNGYDAINFLLPYNVTTDNTIPVQCLVKYDYIKGTLLNVPITSPFTEANGPKTNLETFLLGDNRDIPFRALKDSDRDLSPQGPQPQYIPIDNKLNNIAYNNVTFGISNEDLLPCYVMNTTSPTNTNSFAFVDLEEEIKAFDENIIKLLADLYGDGVRLNVDLDTSKTDKNNYRVISSVFSNDINVKVAKSQLYNSFILQNMFLSFTTNGQLYREPGKFINITKDLSQNNTGSAFEKKIIGQWLITEVKHIITGNGLYKNLIQCVKPFVNK